MTESLLNKFSFILSNSSIRMITKACSTNIIIMCIGEEVLMNRRWYDSNENTEKALSLLKNMDENQRRALSKDLTTVVKQIKEMREEDEEQDVSIGIDRVLGLYKLSNSRRWYDKVSILSYALKTMSTLPREDFYNVMEGVYSTLSA